MKYLLPLFLATKLWGQAFTPQDLPWLVNVNTPNTVSLCLPTSALDKITGLYLKLLSDCSGSITNTANNSNVTNWFDLTTYANNFAWVSSATLGFNTIPPVYKLNLTPNGLPALDFATAGLCALLSNNSLSNQPNTIIYACQINKTSTGFNGNYTTFHDSQAGGRSLFQTAPVLIGGVSPEWYCGTTLIPTPYLAETNWMVWSITDNGANSYVRTNGVNFLVGNPGAAGFGRMIMGADNTGASVFFGKMAGAAAYHAVLATNDLQTAERALGSHFGIFF